MRRVIGIGETILDILFKNNQPVAAVPGGSTFNAMVSLSRLGVPAVFVSEVGDDRVGSMIRSFMDANHMDTKYVEVNPDARSAVSLAFLNEQQDAEYVFYKDHPKAKLENAFPVITADDIVLFGSYYALNPVLRPRMIEFLETARDNGAIIYYDVNFRQTHQDEAVRLSTIFIENFEFADIVRGSKEDFHYLYRLDEVDKIYQEKIHFYTPYFIYTAGEKGVEVRAGSFSKKYPARSIQPVSTVGAGDSFNAGILFGLLRSRIRRSDLSTLTERDWDAIIRCGVDFSSEVCLSYDNYLSSDYAANYAYHGE
jgi:fructokinase